MPLCLRRMFCLSRRSFGETMRPDAWWTQPLLSFWVSPPSLFTRRGRRFQGTHYCFDQNGAIISRRFIRRRFSAARPTHFWSRPETGGRRGSSFSPALLILWAPAGFRLTCYYYRGAYYKAFWADPPACAVGEPRKSYLGENSFPLIMQNVHRYFMYLALIFILILAHDVWKAMWFADSGVKARSASASERSCWRSTSCCSGVTLLAVIRCAI